MEGRNPMSVQQVCRRAAVVGAVAVALLVAPIVAAGSEPRTAPSTPTNVTIASANRSLLVSWSASSGNPLLYVATAKAPGRATRTCKVKHVGCLIPLLVNGVAYDVTVAAKNLSGSSAPSPDQTATVGVPGPPTNVHTSPAIASAIVFWSAPLLSGVARIQSYVATASPGGYSCSTSGTIIGTTARSCTIPGLTPGTTYQVTVVATNVFGASAPSKPVQVAV
jgi:hypothetical protein